MIKTLTLSSRGVSSADSSRPSSWRRLFRTYQSRELAMASTKGRIIRMVSGVALNRATVEGIENYGGFVRLRMSCKDYAEYIPGSKIQLLLPSNDMRTYSPISELRGLVLLAWTGGGGPGSTWAARAKLGQTLPFVGPQKSLEADSGSVIVVGDETSLALAAAFALDRPLQAYAVIQSDAEKDARGAAASIGLVGMDVVSPGDLAAMVEVVRRRLLALPGATILLTGGSDLVISVREALRMAGVGNIKAKAYWVPGRVGVD